MVMRACDRCHRRKSRCDKRDPCGPCQKAGVACTYSASAALRIRGQVHQAQPQSEDLDLLERQQQRQRHLQRSEDSTGRTAPGDGGPAGGSLSNSQPYRRLSVSHNAASPQPRSVTNSNDTNNGLLRPLMSPSAVTPRSQPNGDVVSEVSYLSMNAAGDRQYLGSTSGVLFANLVRSSVELPSPSHPADTVQARSRNSHHLEREESNPRIQETHASPQHRLPPRSLARKLVHAYLEHDHLAYPFLLPSFLLDIVEKMYSTPNFHAQNRFEGFCFDMVLAISIATVYKYDWQLLPDAESHHARALSVIDPLFQSGGLQSLQAVLLLCQHRIASSVKDNSASMWHLVGIGARAAFALGLHRKSAYALTRPKATDSQVLLRQYQDQEIRLRCFWCITAMDRVVSLILGRPMAIHSDYIEADLPQPADDDIFYADFQPSEEEVHSRTHLFNHIIEYRMLCGKIMITLAQKHSADDSIDTQRIRIDELVIALSSWRDRTAALNLPSDESKHGFSEGPGSSSFRSRSWYELLYHNAVLLATRPSPGHNDTGQRHHLLQRIYLSAKEAIHLYSDLHQSGKINYSWITLHSVFMAGISYVYAVSRHFRAQNSATDPAWRRLDHEPSAVEIVNDTRACSNVLVAVSERWNAVRHCHKVFDRLSDAILAEAVQSQCRRSAMRNPSPLRDTHHHFHSSSSQWPNNMQPNQDLSSTMNGLSGEGFLVSDNRNQEPQAEPLSTFPFLVVDDEFRTYFEDLQNFYHEQQMDDPLRQLSYDWLGQASLLEDPFLSTGAEATSM